MVGFRRPDSEDDGDYLPPTTALGGSDQAHGNMEESSISVHGEEDENGYWSDAGYSNLDSNMSAAYSQTYSQIETPIRFGASMEAMAPPDEIGLNPETEGDDCSILLTSPVDGDDVSFPDVLSPARSVDSLEDVYYHDQYVRETAEPSLPGNESDAIAVLTEQSMSDDMQESSKVLPSMKSQVEKAITASVRKTSCPSDDPQEPKGPSKAFLDVKSFASSVQMKRSMSQDPEDPEGVIPPTSTPMKSVMSSPKTTRIIFAIAAIVVIAIVIGVGIAMSQSDFSSTPDVATPPESISPTIAPTPSPTEPSPTEPANPPEPDSTPSPTSAPTRPLTLEQGNVDQYRDFLYPISGASLDDTTSPQFKAMVWVANETVPGTEEAIEVRYAAGVVYYSLGGEAWREQFNFLSQDSLCLWNNGADQGILCTNDEISDLVLRKNDLIGTSPHEVSFLSTLKTISFKDNAVVGTMPSTVGDLNQLESVDLTANSMTGALPDTLFTLGELKELILDGNPFTGTIASTAGSNNKLERFTALGSSLSGTLPESIGQCTTLQYLDLTGNSLTGTIPDFHSSSYLGRLFLGFNNLEGPIPQSIGSVVWLEEISLSGNALTGTIPDFSQNDNVLHKIDISDNNLSGNIEAFFTTTPANTVKTVNFSNNALQGSIPADIVQFTELTELILTGNNLTGSIPNELGDMSILRDLFLDFNNLQGTIPTSLAGDGELDNLLLTGNAVTNVNEFCSIGHSLKAFAVNTCSNITIECFCCNACCNADSFECSELTAVTP